MLPLRDFRAGLPDWLACPKCRGALAAVVGALECRGCRARFPQGDPWLDLRPSARWHAADPTWTARQGEMETAYRDLIADPAHARLAYQYDFGPFAAVLAEWRGRVLDIGGGNGLVRHVLPPGCEYISLDPGVAWLEEPWAGIADAFPCLREPLAFVRGVGEQLPVADAGIDGVLSFWSLNHAAEPARVVGEIARVLRPGGRALVVLDDVEPRWGDIASRAYGDERYRTRRALAWRKLRAQVAGWPRQADHLPIAEADLRRWAAGRFTTPRRLWVGRYFTLELARTP